MAYWKCLECEYKTGVPETHTTEHEPFWDHCTCGSGAHPRRCLLHPGEYEKHIAELNLEAEIDNAGQ